METNMIDMTEAHDLCMRQLGGAYCFSLDPKSTEDALIYRLRIKITDAVSNFLGIPLESAEIEMFSFTFTKSGNKDKMYTTPKLSFEYEVQRAYEYRKWVLSRMVNPQKKSLDFDDRPLFIKFTINGKTFRFQHERNYTFIEED